MLMVAFNLNAQDFWEPLISSPDSALSIAINANGHIFVGTYNNIFRSTDNGGTWTGVNSGLPALGRWSPIAINPNGHLFAAHSDYYNTGYVYRSIDNGEHWVKSDSGMSNPQTYDIAFASNGDIFLSSYLIPIESGNSNTYGLFVSHDNGVTWGLTSYPTQYPCTIKINAQGDIFVGDRFGIYKSTDQGQSWSVTNPGGIDFNTISINSRGHILAITVFGWGMWRSTDNGINWSLVNNGTVDRVIVNDLDELFGGIYEYGVYKSTDNGYNWFPVNEGLTDLYVWSLAIDMSGYIYVGTPTGIFRSINSTVPVELVSFNSSITGNNIQLSWQTATEINNQGFEIYRNGNKIAFVDGKGTTTETQDYSFTDKNLQPGIYNYRLNQLDFDGTQKVVGELTVYLTLPEQFSLEQNYPNPFNPSTTIKYSIPTSEFVSLKVYDVLGNEVATLVNEEKPAGSYEVNFNAAKLSSGIYFYTLHAGSHTQTKKLILLK